MTVKTRLYACGGAGVNLGQRANPERVSPCYIDTSQSNRTEALDQELCYFIEELDGSGKNRKENYSVIAKEVDTILARFQPGDFNIVMFGAAGGSGSVLGPLLMKALLENKETVVAIVIGSDDSAIAVTNTVNTLKSLESISVMVGEPAVMVYHENTSGVPRKVIDDEVEFVLHALETLTSQENQELDTRDLTNWVQYQKVCPVRPQLSALSVFDNRQEAAKQLEPVSVASLYADPDKDNPFGTPHYATVGYPRQGTMDLAEQLHFVINIADVEETFNHLSERQTELNRAYSSYRQRKAMVDVDDNLTGDGMVL
jgi:hypothetical protein